MAYNLKLSDQADEDALIAFDYYGRINTALGDRFLTELFSTYSKIVANPELNSFISSNPKDKFRDLKLRTFPYVIIYEIYGNDILVSEILNTRRKPFVID